MLLIPLFDFFYLKINREPTHFHFPMAPMKSAN